MAGRLGGVAFTDDKFKFEPDAATGVREATLRAIYGADGFVEGATAEAGQTLGLVLDQSSFFSQAGGQVPDVGSLVGASDDASFTVTSVQSFGGYVLHIGTLESGSISAGMTLRTEVDYARRLEVSKSHTLTHVLNLALHQVL